MGYRTCLMHVLGADGSRQKLWIERNKKLKGTDEMWQTQRAHESAPFLDSVIIGPFSKFYHEILFACFFFNLFFSLNLTFGGFIIGEACRSPTIHTMGLLRVLLVLVVPYLFIGPIGSIGSDYPTFGIFIFWGWFRPMGFSDLSVHCKIQWGTFHEKGGWKEVERVVCYHCSQNGILRWMHFSEFQ